MTNETTLAGIEPVAWAHEQGPNKLVDAYNKSKHPESFAYFTEPLYSAATVERLVQERNQWGAKLLREFCNSYCWDHSDGRYYRDELRRKADELEEGKGNG